MHIHYTNLWGNVSPIIPIPWLTLWMCGNAIYWMYSPTQNTMIISNTFYPSLIYSLLILYLIPVKTKSGPAVTAAFRSIFYDKPILHSRRPVWVRMDKGKEFLNKYFQDILRDEGIQFQVCRNPDVKCAVVERAQRTIRDRLYKYFTYKNTFRYIDVLPKFVRAYNDTVHSTTGVPPSRVTDSDVLAIWKRMNPRRIRVAKVKFSVGQHVRISKENMKSAKVSEQLFSTEIFRISKVIDRRPRPVYELEDLNKTPSDICTYWPPQSGLRSQAGPATSHILHQRRQDQLRVCRLLPGTRLSTLGRIRRHSKGRVQDPHSLRRTNHCAGGLFACYTRLHVSLWGPCRHQVREWQLPSAHPQEARLGQAVCGQGIHKPDTT